MREMGVQNVCPAKPISPIGPINIAVREAIVQNGRHAAASQSSQSSQSSQILKPHVQYRCLKCAIPACSSGQYLIIAEGRALIFPALNI